MMLAIGPHQRFQLLKGICSEISQSTDGISDAHISSLYELVGKTLEKALEVIEKNTVEYVTVDSKRSYFIVRRTQRTYYLYSTILFCACPHFQFNVVKNKSDFMCKHVVACHVALATKKCQFHTSSVYMWPELFEDPRKKPD